MDGLLTLSKFYNINLSLDDPSILFFHHFQKLVKDSQQPEGLDPFPVKHIGNLNVFFEAMSKLFSRLVEAVIKSSRNR